MFKEKTTWILIIMILGTFLIAGISDKKTVADDNDLISNSYIKITR